MMDINLRHSSPVFAQEGDRECMDETTETGGGAAQNPPTDLEAVAFGRGKPVFRDSPHASRLEILVSLFEGCQSVDELESLTLQDWQRKAVELVQAATGTATLAGRYKSWNDAINACLRHAGAAAAAAAAQEEHEQREKQNQQQQLDVADGAAAEEEAELARALEVAEKLIAGIPLDDGQGPVSSEQMAQYTEVGKGGQPEWDDGWVATCKWTQKRNRPVGSGWAT